jgi:hypothetical protein
MTDKPDTVNLGAIFEAHRWDGKLRITIQGAVSYSVSGGPVALNADSWRADVYVGRKRVMLPLLGTSPADVLRGLAEIANAGELTYER